MASYGTPGTPTYSVTYTSLDEMLGHVPDNLKQQIVAADLRNSLFTVWDKIGTTLGPTGPIGPIGYVGPTGPQGYTGPTGPIGPTGSVGDRYSTISYTSFIVPLVGATVSFLVDVGLAYTPSQGVVVSPVLDPDDHFRADIRSYDLVTGSMSVVCTGINLDGTESEIEGATYSYWRVNLSGAVGVPGDIGPTGPTGPIGATGATGPQGNQGIQGPQGPFGPQGPEGPHGATGQSGLQGVQGVQGPIGNTGSTGPIGPIGETGSIGPTGATGATGATGLLGPIGPTGPIGETGPVGPIGPTGATGPNLYLSYIDVNSGYLKFLNNPNTVASVSASNQFVMNMGQNWNIMGASYGTNIIATSSNFHIAFYGGSGTSSVDVSSSSIPVGTAIIVSDVGGRSSLTNITISAGVGNKISYRTSAGVVLGYTSTWALTTNNNAVVDGLGSSYLTASSVVFGSNTPNGGNSSNGLKVGPWAAGYTIGSTDPNSYVDFTLSTVGSYFLSNLSVAVSLMNSSGSSTLNQMLASFQYSVDGGVTFTEFGVVTIPIVSGTYVNAALPTTISDTANLHIRLYFYGAVGSSTSTSRFVYVRNMVLSGTDYYGTTTSYILGSSGASVTLQKVTSSIWQVISTN